LGITQSSDIAKVVPFTTVQQLACPRAQYGRAPACTLRFVAIASHQHELIRAAQPYPCRTNHFSPRDSVPRAPQANSSSSSPANPPRGKHVCWHCTVVSVWHRSQTSCDSQEGFCNPKNLAAICDDVDFSTRSIYASSSFDDSKQPCHSDTDFPTDKRTPLLRAAEIASDIDATSSLSDEVNGEEIGQPRSRESEDARCIKAGILQHLAPASFTGPFYSHAINSNPCNPGLHLKDYGWLGLPFSARDLASLHAHQNPHSPDLTATSSPIVFTLEDLKCTNPEWSEFVGRTKVNLLQQCGITADCGLSSVRVLLCQSQDLKEGKLPASPYRPDEAFGTLLFTVPSEHRNLTIEFRYGGETSKMGISTTEMFSSLSCLWVDGVHHEIQFDSSGVVLLLEYDLIWNEKSSKPSASSAATMVAKLREALQTWTTGLRTQQLPRFLGYRLSETLSAQNLQQSSFRGRDQQCFNLLKQACENSGCTLHLARVVRSITGSIEGDRIYSRGPDHEITELEDDSTVVRLYEASGAHLGDSKYFEEISFLQEDVYDIGRTADEEEEDKNDEYNEGYSIRGYYHGSYLDEPSTITHTYRDSALLLIPDDRITSLLVNHIWEDRGGSTRALWVRNAFNKWQYSQEACEEWVKLCKLILAKLEKTKQASTSYHYWVPASTVEYPADVWAIVATASEVDHSQTGSILQQALPLLISASGKLSDSHISLMTKVAMHIRSSPEVRDTIEQIIRRPGSIHDYFQELSNFCHGCLVASDSDDERFDGDTLLPTGWLLDGSWTTRTVQEETLLGWARTCVKRAIERADLDAPTTPADFSLLLSLATGEVRHLILQACLTSINRTTVTPSQVLQIFKSFSAQKDPDGEHQKITSSAYEILLRLMQRQPVAGEVLLEVVENVTKQERNLTAQLVHALLPSQQMHMSGGMPSRSISFIPDVVRAGSIAAEQSRYVNMLSTILLTAFLVFEMGAEPQSTGDLRRPGLPCHSACHVCTSLNGFLGSSTQRSFVSPGWRSTSNRVHAQDQLHRCIPNYADVLRDWIARAPGSQTHQLYIEKGDYKYDRDHQAWGQKLQTFSGAVSEVLKLQLQQPSQLLFGDLYEALAKHDVYFAQGFLRDAAKQSLLNYHFHLPDAPKQYTAYQLRLMIESCGGSIKPVLQPEGTIGGFTLVTIIPEADAAADSPAGSLQDTGEQADCVQQIAVSETELETFINERFGDSLMERLNIPQSTNVAPLLRPGDLLIRTDQADQSPSSRHNPLKRKAVDISRAPLASLANTSPSQSRTAMDPTEPVAGYQNGQKRPRPSVGLQEEQTGQENGGREDRIEIVDLT